MSFAVQPGALRGSYRSRRLILPVRYVVIFSLGSISRSERYAGGLNSVGSMSPECSVATGGWKISNY